MKSLFKLVLPLLMAFSFSLHAQKTITDIVVESPDHNTLEAAVIAANLAGTLAGPGPFTVFAPTDAAFAALGQNTIDALLADPSGALTYVLTQHVVNGVAGASSIFDGQKMANLAGQNLEFSTSGGVTVNGINITVTDIRATNGVVHVIDAVINRPQTVVDVVVNSPDHNTLEAAVIAAGLAPALSSADFVTVFAPTDAAFAALGQQTIDALLADPTGALADILLYHVVTGTATPQNIVNSRKIGTLQGSNIDFNITANGVQINNANVTVANIEAGNGIVHVIDAVLTPDSGETVVDIIVNSPDHNTLEAAVIAAGLAPTLASADFVTVFAPTDAAFAALGQTTIDALLADPTGDLADILLYHVVQGAATPDNMVSPAKIATLAGTNIDFVVTQNGVQINNANVTVANIRTNNGIVHVIDAVLLPDAGQTVVDVIVNSPDHNTLETAVLAAGLEGALSGDGPFTVFAPTDAAFAALDPAVLDAALADPQGLLTQVLTYHVVNGVAEAASIFDGQRMATLLGKNIEFSTTAGVKVNNANIIVTDIRTRNGVVHVIDAVLLP